MYHVKARYYANPDQFGESFVLQSDNGGVDKRLEVGTKALILSEEECEVIWNTVMELYEHTHHDAPLDDCVDRVEKVISGGIREEQSGGTATNGSAVSGV